MNALAQISATLLLVLLGGWAIARPVAALDDDRPSRRRRFERAMLRMLGGDEMSSRQYFAAVVMLNIVGVVVVYALQRLQHLLPLNPMHLPAVSPVVALNTAVSFASNTNWQAYGGETTMSFLTQMAALTTQNFVSAATGIAVVFALARGFTRTGSSTIGNFWLDLVRGLFVLVPMSLVLALLLVFGGVPQTLTASATAQLIQGGEQLIALGPVASQVAIKQLGTNGGGFFNVNSAHPLENPTPWTNLLELVSILIIPAAMCFVWGRLVKDRAHGRALLLIMAVLFVPAVVAVTIGEQQAPTLQALGVDDALGNMEGKEVRFGTAQSSLWAVATTAASNGSVNAMHDSFQPLTGGVLIVMMALGEVVFGGVGSGLYGLMLFVIVAVFITGLMVGRTPELLGKKIEAAEMKAAVLAILAPSACVLVGLALACVVPEGAASVANPGAHGFSELLYAFVSTSNNNGSAFGGLTVNGPFLGTAHAVCMWIGRFFVIGGVLTLAQGLAMKNSVPTSTATLPTRGALFVTVVAGTVVLVGALTFVPALALGPVADHFDQDVAAAALQVTP
jgi:K+-transporting ATPase ATPase A chain